MEGKKMLFWFFRVGFRVLAKTKCAFCVVGILFLVQFFRLWCLQVTPSIKLVAVKIAKTLNIRPKFEKNRQLCYSRLR